MFNLKNHSHLRIEFAVYLFDGRKLHFRAGVAAFGFIEEAVGRRISETRPLGETQ